MQSQHMSLGIDEDIAETQKLLTVVTRPIVRDRLIQLLGSLHQVHSLLCHSVCQSWSHFAVVKKAAQAAFVRLPRAHTLASLRPHVRVVKFISLAGAVFAYFWPCPLFTHRSSRHLTLGVVLSRFLLAICSLLSTLSSICCFFSTQQAQTGCCLLYEVSARATMGPIEHDFSACHSQMHSSC